MFNHRLSLYYIIIIILSSCSEELQIVNSDDSMLTKEKGILYYRNKPFSGMITNSYHDGLLRSKQSYILGKRHGRYLEWYPNGQSGIAKNIVRAFKMESRKNGIAMAHYQEKCNSMKEGKKGNK